jgi:hypothetical protein
MKAQILKIAGVKNEKEFYKKFPREEDFMAKHGKELKKAQVGTSLVPGLEGTGGMTSGAFINKAGQVDSISGKVSRADTTALGFENDAPGKASKEGYDYGSLVGPAIAGIQDAQANSAYNKKLDQYLEISNLIGRIPQNRQQ